MHPIIDAHLDLAWNALSWNRDLRLPLDQLNASEKHMTDTPARGRAAVSLPEMRRGKIVACLGTLLVRCKPNARPAEGHRRRDLDVASPEIAHAIAIGHIAYYRELARQGEIHLLSDAQAFRRHVDAAQGVGVIIAMEGADPIVSPDAVQQWWDAGLRCVGMAHYGQGRYAMGTGEAGDVTPAGIELLPAFERVGMIVDLTHCGEPGFYTVLDRFGGRVLASHNNCRALVPGDRQFSDEQIKLLIERDAVIGSAFDAWMLHPGYERGKTPREAVTLEAVTDHIDHICQLAGDCKHVGIGSDIDGGFGTEQCPAGIESIADLQKMEAVLKSRGYSDDDVAAIFYRNWLSFFSEALPS